jgi:poly-gamma-glutamate synthesis protein (capsule biosynthesis protein)
MGVIRISCAGDLLPADTAYTLGKGIGSSMARLISYYSVKENNPFLNSDIVFCNLEAPLIFTHGSIKLPFEGNPDVIDLMKILNVSVVSIANNHMLDHGQEGFVRTNSLLKENGFLKIGSSEKGISEIGSIECRNKKLVFAAFNDINDHPEDKLIARLDRGILFKTLDEIKKLSSDFIIYSLHWGNEYVTWPSPSQVGLAHELIDSGVNIIVGHHPHVVQPIEKYNGGIILYSLGNFIFDMFWSSGVRNGMYVDLLLNGDKSIDYQVNPYRIKSDFTQDYSKRDRILSILSGAGKTLTLLRTGSRINYNNRYILECKEQRLQARIKMKFCLLMNLFRLSPQSRSFLFNNLKIKFLFLWKKN